MVLGSFFKKDILVFWRDRKEILMSLLLPIVIIFILNLAFSGIFDDDGEPVEIDIAIVQEDDPSAGLEQFENTVKGIDSSPAEQAVILKEAESLGVENMIQNFFDAPDLKDWISTQELSEKRAQEKVKNGEIDSYIKIPEGFTYDVLSRVMFGTETEKTITIQAEEHSREVGALQDIVHNFIQSLNMQFALSGNTGQGTGVTEPKWPQGGREVVEGVETYTISQYFTIAISTLFALFISQTVAIKTATEKRERVFNRIILTGSRPMDYLMGKTLATFCLTWSQMMITFTFIQLALDVFPDRSLEFWIGLIIIISAFALTVSGLGALFTSISLSIQDTNAASGVLTMIIMLLGALGGNFFPMEGLPVFMQRIGEWTPNGLTQTALIEWIQFSSFRDLIEPLMLMLLFFIICLVIGISSFPRRRRI